MSPCQLPGQVSECSERCQDSVARPDGHLCSWATQGLACVPEEMSMDRAWTQAAQMDCIREHMDVLKVIVALKNLQ